MTKKYISFLMIIAIIFASINIFNNITIEFTPQRWNSNVYARKRMVESLFDKYDLYSMSKKDLFNLLGRKGILEISERDCTYFLGRGLGNVKKLCISFDDNDMVRSVINFKTNEGIL